MKLIKLIEQLFSAFDDPGVHSLCLTKEIRFEFADAISEAELMERKAKAFDRRGICISCGGENVLWECPDCDLKIDPKDEAVEAAMKSEKETHGKMQRL